MTSRGDRRLWDDAASWYARMQEPEGEAEVAEFEAWLARDRNNARAYHEIDAVSAAVAGARHGVTEAQPPSEWGGWRPVLAAAAILAVLTLTILTWQGFSGPAYARVSNPGEAVRGVRLVDGTRLWLDAGSEVDVRIDDDHREIVVRTGRVRIGPAAGGPPLEVAAEVVTVPAATSPLDVTIGAGSVIVGALEGPISVVPVGSTAFTLGAGRSVIVDRGGARPIPFDRGWPRARLRFTNATLAQVAAIANRQAGADIVFADPVIPTLTVTGVLDLRDTRRLARKLAAAHDLQLREDSQKLILER